MREQRQELAAVCKPGSRQIHSRVKELIPEIRAQYYAPLSRAQQDRLLSQSFCACLSLSLYFLSSSSPLEYVSSIPSHFVRETSFRAPHPEVDSGAQTSGKGQLRPGRSAEGCPEPLPDPARAGSQDACEHNSQEPALREGPGRTDRKAPSTCPDTFSSKRGAPFEHVSHIKGIASENWQAQTISFRSPVKSWPSRF